MRILTIDLEDWFHILDHDETASPAQWEKFETRVERNTDWILGRLSERKQVATFFCLGWIAKKHPGLVKKIAEGGHEIACHSMNHQLVYMQSRSDFRNDLRQSIDILENITGRKVKSYRAPGFSVTRQTDWVFEELLDAGLENDCSVFPSSRNHGGYPGFPYQQPCLLSVGGRNLREFPMNLAFGSRSGFVFTGGGYFRLLPWVLIKRLMGRSDYVMTYFHPRDFDPGQPMLSGLGLKRKFMSYVGLRHAPAKFENMLQYGDFVNVTGAAALIDWTNTPVMKIS